VLLVFGVLKINQFWVHNSQMHSLVILHLPLVLAVHLLPILSGITLGYGLDNWFESQQGHIQTGSGAHPAFSPVGTRGSLSGGKAVRA